MADLSPNEVFGTDSAIEKLVEKLDQTFPLYNPSPEDELSKIMYLAGQRSVVEFIQSLIED